MRAILTGLFVCVMVVFRQICFHVGKHVVVRECKIWRVPQLHSIDLMHWSIIHTFISFYPFSNNWRKYYLNSCHYIPGRKNGFLLFWCSLPVANPLHYSLMSGVQKFSGLFLKQQHIIFGTHHTVSLLVCCEWSRHSYCRDFFIS